MADLRPRNMTQAEFAAMLQREGFSACSKTAVSLAERPAESGVQFTPQARKVAQGLLKSTRRAENRANPNKTTVWLDDDLRAWVEQKAYLDDTNVGTVIRDILAQAMSEDKRKHDKYRALQISDERYMELAMEETPLQKLVREIEEARKAASDAATSEAAGAPETNGRQSAVPTGHLHDSRNKEENQG